jgi:hypothetical protein
MSDKNQKHINIEDYIMSAINNIKQNFKELVKLSLVLILLFIIVEILLTFIFGVQNYNSDQEIAIKIILSTLIAIVIYNIFYYTWTKNIISHYRKESPRILDVLKINKDVIVRSSKIFIGFLLYVIIVAIGLVLLIVPGIYLMNRYGYFYLFIIDKNTSIIESFKMSAKITKNNNLKILMLNASAVVIFCLFLLASFVIIVILESILRLITSNIDFINTLLVLPTSIMLVMCINFIIFLSVAVYEKQK